MRFYFGGAEAPTHRSRLTHAGAQAVSVGLLDLWPRLSADGPWDVTEKFEPHVDVLLDLQGQAAERRDMPDEDVMVYLNRVLPLVVQNAEHIDGVVEFDFGPWGASGVAEGREKLGAHLPLGVLIPVWHPDDETLDDLAADYRRVAIPKDVATAMDSVAIRRVRAIAASEDLSLHGLGVTDQKVAAALRLDSVSSSAWTATVSRGETTLWERNRIQRYRGEDKEEVRTTKRALIEDMGVDPDEVLADNPQALTTLAVCSWQAWASHNSDRPSQLKSGHADKSLQPSTGPPAPPAPARWNGVLPEGMTLLPVLGTTPAETGEGLELTSTAGSMRTCDTCVLARMCPAYVPGSACTLAIPVDIRDKSDLIAAMRNLLEMQFQRASFAKFAEDVMGEGASPETSREFDRFMDMTEKMKRTLENRDFMRVTVESSGGAGVLSRLFGEEAGRVNRQMDAGTAEDIIAEVLD